MRYILGVPEQGFHATRIFGYALNDTIGTIFLSIITSYVWRVPITYSLAGWFIGGEILHYLFGTQTAFLTTLGIEACPSISLVNF
jgi:hypothetical protein